MTNPNDIIINLQVNGINQLHALSAGLRNINATMQGATAGASRLDATQKGLNQALGGGIAGSQKHAKSLKELVQNQSALGNEMRRTTSDMKMLTRNQASVGVTSQKMISGLKSYSSTLKSVKAKVLVSDLKSLSSQMVLTGKNAQWTGRQLMTGLTLPILAFGRIALGSFAAVDKELTKLDKLLENASMTADRAFIKMSVSGKNAMERLANADPLQKKQAEEQVERFKSMEDAFTSLAQKFGDNKSLVISLGVDFAQLGLSSKEALSSLTESVLMAEQLGDVDIAQSKDLIQTIYFQATKALDNNARAHDDVKDAVQRETSALNIVNGTLARFNLIENTTVLSLNDIAKALPEAGAAATQFGLSMSEAMGLLAPMKAAGFDTASSANAIKVSLQRLTDPTEESKTMYEELTKVMGFDFKQAASIGINSLDYLSQAFTKVRESGAGVEGAMEFMTQLFVLRQGPRMAESIADIAEFNTELTRISENGLVVDKSLKDMVDAANKLRKEGSAAPLLKSYSDFGNLARISSMHISDDLSKNVIELIEDGKTVVKTITQADVDNAAQMRAAVGELVLDRRAAGEDLIVGVRSQVGRVMVAQLVGVEDAAKLAEQEVDIALKSVSASTSRIRVNFQLIASELIKGFKPVIQFIDKAMYSLANAFRNMSGGTKTAIAVIIAGIAALGPLIYAFNLAKVAVGTLMGAFFKLLPSVSMLNAQVLAMNPALMRLTKPVVMVGSSFQTAATRSQMFIARLASMRGPVGIMANRFGILTGALQKVSTASAEAEAATKALSSVSGASGAVAGGNVVSILRQGSRLQGPPAPVTNAPVGAVGQRMFDRHKNMGGSFTKTGKMKPFVPNRGQGALLPMTPKQLATARARTIGAMHRGARLGLSDEVVDLMPRTAPAIGASERAQRRAERAAVDRRFVRGTKQKLSYIAGAGSTPGAPIAQAQYRMASLKKNPLTSAIGKPDYSRLVDLTPKQEMRIANGGVIGALQKAKLRVTPTVTALKGKLISGMKGIKNAAVSGMKHVGNAFTGTMTSMTNLFSGFSGVMQTPLPSIKAGFNNMKTMIANGYARTVGVAKSGINKLIAVIKTGKISTAIQSFVKNPIASFKVLGASIKARYAQMSNFFTASTIGTSGLQLKLKMLVFKQISFLKSIMGITAFKTAINKTRLSMAAMAAQQKAYNFSSVFMMAKTAVFAFTKSLFASMNVMKMVKIVMMSMGIVGVIFAAVAVILTLINSFKSLGSKSEATKKTFRETFHILGQIVGSVIKPFKNLIATFMNLMTGSVGTQKQFEGMGAKIKGVAKSVKAFFDKYIIPALNFLLVGAVNQVRAIVKIVKGFINIFKGDWKKGLFQILQGIVLFAGVAVKLIIKIVSMWIDTMVFLYKHVLKIVGELAKGMTNLMGAAIKWIIMKFHTMISTITDFMRHIPGLKQIRSMLLGAIEASANALDATFSGIGKVVSSITDKIAGIAGGLGDAAKGVLTRIGTLAEGVFERIVESTTALIDSGSDSLVDGAEDAAKAYEDVFNDPPAGGLGKIINEAEGELLEMLTDLRQKFVDLVLDAVSETVSKVVEDMTDALEKQKDAALHVYDVQIETLNKLAKAEESLTKEKEYQAERRKIIDERQLQVANYVRNRALAIYEGRIDDARVLALEDRKSGLDFTLDLGKVDDARTKDLVQENFEALKEQISKAKEEADKFFDDQIQKFKDAAAVITKFPPQTIEEYETQLGQLNTVATGIATANGVIFEGMLNKMATDIKLPNAGVAVFGTSLDALIVEASNKYGLLSTTADNTIIGATIGMIAGIEGQIGDHALITAAMGTLVTDVFDQAKGFNKIATDIVTPALTALGTIFTENNPFATFTEAVLEANTTLLRDFTKIVGGVGSVVDGLATKLSSVVEQLATVIYLKNVAAGDTPGSGNSSGNNAPNPVDAPPSWGNALPGGSGGAVVGAPGPSPYPLETIAKVKSDLMSAFKATQKTNPDWALFNTQERADAVDQAARHVVEVRNRSRIQGHSALQANNAYRAYRDTIESEYLNQVKTMFSGEVGIPSAYNGGKIPKFGNGGYSVPGFGSQPVPAILHGGEYVINSRSVANVGMATLSMLNDLRFKKPNYDAPVSNGGGSSSVTTTNIYVDNFIGEDKWFQEMLKQYNMNVLPNNQKSAGMENRVVKSYSGLARGM
jgi:hypothetical protein